jgi:hypothetical protein
MNQCCRRYIATARPLEWCGEPASFLADMLAFDLVTE